MTAATPLPNAESALAPPEKIRDYALNPEHPIGSHKARVFAATLGIRQQDWEYLRAQILVGIRSVPASRSAVTPYGEHYRVRLQIMGRNRRTMPVMTAWFVPQTGEPVPRLVSLWVDIR